MKSEAEIRAEIAKRQSSREFDSPTDAEHNEARIAALTWVLSDPAPIHIDPPTTQEP